MATVVIAVAAVATAAIGSVVGGPAAWGESAPASDAASNGELTDATGPQIETVERILYGPSALDLFRYPRGIVADSARGVFLVADTGNHRVIVFDASGRCRGSISFQSDKPGGTPGEPISLALDPRGRIFLVDAVRPEVEVLSPTGSHIAAFDPPLPSTAEGLSRPQAIAIGASGRIYLACAGERSGLLVLAPDGSALTAIGFPAPGSGTWLGPIAVAVNADESLVAVLDPQAEKAIWFYQPDGTFVAACGEHGTGPGTFSMACHAVFDAEGFLWVTDTLRHSITIIDPRGGHHGRIGGFGRGPGQFNHPSACAFLARDRLVVLERAGARCQIFDLIASAPAALLRPTAGGLAE